MDSCLNPVGSANHMDSNISIVTYTKDGKRIKTAEIRTNDQKAWDFIGENLVTPNSVNSASIDNFSVPRDNRKSEVIDDTSILIRPAGMRFKPAEVTSKR